MNYTADQAKIVLSAMKSEMEGDTPPELKVMRLWWTMVFMRTRVLTNTLRALIGECVNTGPFKGMQLTQEATNGYGSCLLLGSYEHELHGMIEKIIAGNYTHILNIGCSVGYYAVGLALRMPHLTIDAFDIDPEARRKCAEMVALNGVQDRVRISGEFHGEDFAAYASHKTLAIVDIEGAELGLLDPALYPALRHIDIVVELHDVMNPQISGIICQRFAASHDCAMIANKSFLPDLSHLFRNTAQISVFDHLMLGWEGRDGPTPWGIFTVKSTG